MAKYTIIFYFAITLNDINAGNKCLAGFNLCQIYLAIIHKAGI